MQIDDYLIDMLEDTKRRSPELFFENIIKTLAEPKVIEQLNTFNTRLQTLPTPGWFAVISGGEALNYYYTSKKYIPTHDWDIRLINVTTNMITHDIAVDMTEIVDEFMTKLATDLNTFFRYDVRAFGVRVSQEEPEYNIKPPSDAATSEIINKRNSIRFFYDHKPLSKWNYLEYEYFDSTGVKSFGRIVDIVVANLIEGSNNESKYKKKYTKESLDKMGEDYLNKMGEDYLAQCKLHPKECKDAVNDAVRDEIIQISNQPGGTLYPNSIEIVIQDTLSKMYYIAPGDLLADTMNMIYLSSLNQSSVTGVPFQNKLIRYMVKYANLLDVVNEFTDLCPAKSCNQINEYMIQRNTNSFFCDLYDQPTKMKIFSSFYSVTYVTTLNYLTNSKICEMCKVLSTIVNDKFNPATDIPRPEADVMVG
jgi:hypothetical protein